MKPLEINQIETKYQIEYYEIIDSTHTHARAEASKTEKKEKLIIAEIQTAGIGTKGRKWYTGAGKNIAMTLLTYPTGRVNQLEGLTTKIARAVQQAILTLYHYKLTIKEPNDLMLHNKKICGILTEVHTQGEKINYLLISIGFNVNEEEFSEETREIATSLKREYKKEFKREEIIEGIVKNIEKEIEF